MRRIRWTARWAVVVATMAVLVVACDSEIGGSVTTQEGASPTTEAPDQTEPPDSEPTTPPETAPPETAPPETAPPDEGGEDGTTDSLTIALVVAALVLLVVAIVGLISSRRRRQTTEAAAARAAVPPPPASKSEAWAPDARQTYAEGRWLHDNMTPELAAWRGESMSGAAAAPDPAAAGHAETWGQIGERMAETTTALYTLEVAVPVQSQPVIRATVEALQGVRSAFDQAAGARLALVDLGAADPAEEELEAARLKDHQAVDHLNASRGVLDGALRNLANLS